MFYLLEISPPPQLIRLLRKLCLINATCHGWPPNWVSPPPTILKLPAWISPHPVEYKLGSKIKCSRSDYSAD